MKTAFSFICLLFISSTCLAMEYEYKTLDYGDWKDQTEKSVLNLYPGFRDNTKAGSLPKNTGDLVLFVAKSRVVIDKPAAQIDLRKLQDLARMQKIKAGAASLTRIGFHDLMPNKEKFLSYKNPRDGWCAKPDDLCVESTFTFEEQQRLMLSAVFFVIGKQDSDIKAQSQVRVMTGDQIQQINELIKLTGIDAKPSAVIVEDLFWFSHVLEYGKIVGVVQPHPSNPNQSVLTGYTVFGVEKKWWNFGFQGITLKDAFLGQRFNGTSGLSMGLPKLTKQLFGELVKEL